VPATPNHHTATVDEPWDGPAEEAKLDSPIAGKVGKAMYGWYDDAGDDPDGDGYPDAKADWSLPHHQVADGGEPGAANLNGVRNALSRLPQSNIPEADHDAVRRHLDQHLADANSSSGDGGSSAHGLTPADGPDSFRPAPLTLGRSLWVIDPEALPALVEAHRARPRALDRLTAAAAAATPRAARRGAGQRAGGTVAVIPLTGVLTPRASLLSFLFGGGGGLVDFRDMFREAVNSPDVGAIVLDVDSPGGLIDLVPETAAEVRAARGAKPIVAVVNTMAASGAYWIACQADELVVTPSGVAGSIGVYMVHEDWSGWNEQQGIVPTYISAGKYKVEGNPDQPLSEEAAADWQREADDLYGLFVADVAAGRGVSEDQVRSGYGQGRTVRPAARVLEAGLADRVDTLENVIGELLAAGSSAQPGAQAARAEAGDRPPDPPSEDPDGEDDEGEVPPETQTDPPPPETGGETASADALLGIRP
jgi:capsid assembly protease